MPPKQFKKYRYGSSGPYSDEYHQLLGKSTWIVIKRLLRQEQSSILLDNDGKGKDVRYYEQLPQFSEGDICTVFSQFGEIADVRFVRHRKTGAFLGTAFVKFVNYQSAILAADSMNSNFDQNEPITLEPIISSEEPTPTSSSQVQSTPLQQSLTNTLTSKSIMPGIVVERCEDAEVPAMYNADVETFPEWQQRCKTAREPQRVFKTESYLL